MKSTLLTLFSLACITALSSCVGLAVKGADEGSKAMEKHDNEVVSDTGEAIQKGVKPINDAKDSVVDAVKDAMD
ncbi:hypothetical protein [Rubritalea marina]|uniref:hypothetical protein n=1 Tax=Rubritalea marina TaxID=361055 RepID=UPI00035CE26B|nr:hypothetical protein [Rubritalea marina]